MHFAGGVVPFSVFLERCMKKKASSFFAHETFATATARRR
jgi:hypothetical protein